MIPNNTVSTDSRCQSLSTCCDGKHDFAFRLRPYAFQYEVSLARVREGEDGTHPCAQLSTIDKASDLRQTLACDVNQKERGFDAMALRKMLIRTGHRRNQLAALAENLKRTLLGFATDQINDRVGIPHRFLKVLGPEVNHSVCAEIAHQRDIIGSCGPDDSQTRATGQ